MGEIKCRAKTHDNCYDGKPEEEIYEMPSGMKGDGTYTPFGVICDVCLPLVEPFASDIDRPAMERAIEHYHLNLDYVRKQDDLEALVVEAREARDRANPGAPSWLSADACLRMAEREIAARQQAC